MSTPIYVKKTTLISPTMDKGGLASGNKRQGTIVDSSPYYAARVYARIRSGTAPTAGGLYLVYLVHFDVSTGTPTYATMGADGTDSAFTGTITEDPILSIPVTASADTWFSATTIVEGLGPGVGFILYNNTSQATHATDADHMLGLRFFYDEVA